MVEASAEFDALADGFDGLIVRTHMMSLPALKVGAEMIAFFQGDGVAFKLGRETAELVHALAEPGAMLFSPGRSRRIWYDWAKVPAGSSETWPRYLAWAITRLRR